MWRGNVSCSIIAFGLLLNRCFQVDLSWFIWSRSAALLVAIGNCSLQLWGKGARGRNKTREEAGMGGRALLWRVCCSEASAEQSHCRLTCGCAQS